MSPSLLRPPPAAPSSAASTGALAALAMAMLLSSLGTSIANVALPTFAMAFEASFQAVQWVVLAYLLAVTTALVMVGRLGDRLGRRRLMLAGLAVFVAGSLACAASPSLGALVAARIVQGLGAAVMMALALALVGDAVPKARAGRAMGLLGTTSAIGTALGPSVGGALVAAAGWPAIFVATAALGLVAFALAVRGLPRDADRVPSPRFDFLGALLLAAALAAYALSMTLPAGTAAIARLAMLVSAAVLAVLFVLVEARASDPLLRLRLFREPGIGAGFLMGALVNVVAMATLVVGPFQLAHAFGLAPAAVGLVMAVGPLVAALVGVPAGRAVDRLGSARPLKAGLVLMLLGCTGFALLPTTLGVVAYLLPLAATTAGFAVFQAANNTAVVMTVAAGQRGLVSALLTLARNLGLVTGASAMGAVFVAAAGSADMARAGAVAVAQGTQAVFAVGGLLVLAALAAARGMPAAMAAAQGDRA